MLEPSSSEEEDEEIVDAPNSNHANNIANRQSTGLHSGAATRLGVPNGSSNVQG